MLRLQPDQERDTIWDALLPAGAAVLPPDLAAIDGLLADPAPLAPFRTLWRERDAATGRHAEALGRPTLAMATYVRLMVIKHRTGWGYVTLVREVADSLHLRRFCLIPLPAPVPTESAVRKLTRRLGSEIVAQLTREVIELAARERRFRPRALWIDSTVVEADIRYPTDSGLAADGVRLLARAGRDLAEAVGAGGGHIVDRSRSVGRCLRLLGRTLRRRTGEAKAEVLRLTGEAGDLLARSIGEARRMIGRVAGETAPEIWAARERLEELVAQAGRIVDQIGRRLRGEPIADRLVSFADPDARPIRKGKLATPTQFGYVTQLAELTGKTGRGARGLLLPPVTRAGSIPENALLPTTLAELGRTGLAPREVAQGGQRWYASTVRAALATAAREGMRA